LYVFDFFWGNNRVMKERQALKLLLLEIESNFFLAYLTC